MRHRQQERDLNGHQEKSNKKHFIALFIMLLLIFGAGASAFNGNQFETTLTLQTWQIVVTGFWFLLCVGILGFVGDSPYFSAVCWMLVYWPLLAMVTALIFYGNANFADIENWILTVFIVAELVTFTVTVFCHWLYPKFVNSTWFLHHIGAKYWKLKVISGWTMTYKAGFWRKRYTCKYEGEFNDEGLPEGSGKWIDDTYGGEILTGKWKNGLPMAPFISRQYGTGDAFRAVPIAYFKATDDTFASNKLVPSNENPAAYGVASVECSVQGAFLKNLPSATQLFEKTVVDGREGECLAECFGYMTSPHTEQVQRTNVEIKTNDPRGVEVPGYVYEPTGQSISAEPTQIVVDIHRDEAFDAAQPSSAKATTDDNFMPFSSFAPKEQEHVLVLEDEEKEGDAEADDADGEQEVNVKFVDIEKESADKKKTVNVRFKRNDSTATFARLEVQNWIRTPHKEALVYFPGFNSPLKQSLESLGQFMAMTKTMEMVHPVVFAWPNGQVPTYFNASAISHSDRNKELLLQLIRGLASAGIRHVHFLSHSMGVQSMLGGFGDKEDGSRSDISLCFRLNHEFAAGDGADDDSLMICKSVTMVNPDFPIEAFIDHAFLSVRRICNHITVVGDRQDQALYYSQIMNGTRKFFGYSQPRILNKDGKESGGNRRRGCSPQNVVGRDIGSIYLPDPQDDDGDEEKASLMADERLLFKGAPAIILSSDGEVQEHLWLDVDVIDTTQLDTNIKDLRHSGFNVNPILLNDLEELIVTGRRAARRSTLLFREGNLYSYCHVPSFVTL